VLKRLNRSRCRSGCELVWAQGTMCRVGAAILPRKAGGGSGEGSYLGMAWTIARSRCTSPYPLGVNSDAPSSYQSAVATCYA